MFLQHFSLLNTDWILWKYFLKIKEFYLYIKISGNKWKGHSYYLAIFNLTTTVKLIWEAGTIIWRRHRLPTPVFLGFPCGSAGKEFACSAGDLGLIPGLGRSPGEGKGYPTSVFWAGELHGLYSPWGHKESDTTERLSQVTQVTRNYYGQQDFLVCYVSNSLQPHGLEPARLLRPWNSCSSVEARIREWVAIPSPGYTADRFKMSNNFGKCGLNRDKPISLCRTFESF